MRHLRLLCALLALFLAGCSTLRDIEPGESPAVVDKVLPDEEVRADKEAPPYQEARPDKKARPDDLDRLLNYFVRIRKLPTVEQGKEREGAQKAYLDSPSEYGRVRLAMLLSLPGTTFGDEARALELIEPVAKNQRALLHPLAILLGTYIQEQRRLSGSVQGLQQNLQGLQQNLQGLQQKIDALKSLDRSLIEREQSGTKKR
jgi:hypothetical protein